ncbi:MAG: hypothetical protein KAQ99_05735 [Candidatus Aureabacteria bacterium]|nr:hypothetical protein [Candidatus Auribacterota bacterium]
MPRVSVWETNEKGPELLEALIGETMPQKKIAQLLGISEAAVSQKKKSELKKVHKAVKQKLDDRAGKRQDLRNEQAEITIDEIDRLHANIERLEDLIKPLHEWATDLLKTPRNIDISDRYAIRMVKDLIGETGIQIERLKKIKGELQPDIAVQVRLDQHREEIKSINQFFVEIRPDLMEEYQTYLEAQN